MSEPTMRSGKICYVEIPATDIAVSAKFYQEAFGWETRRRGDGATAFDDTVSQVSGTWVLGRPPASELGLLVYIMTADAAKASETIVAAGGEIVRPVDPSATQVHFIFRDPAGNLLGVYQEPSLKEAEEGG